MRKIILILMSILATQVVQSQNSEPNAVRFGIKAGVNISHINFSKGSPPPDTPIETSWGEGISIGLFMKVPFAENLFVQPEYLYSEMGGEIKDPGTKFDFNYFSLPVLLRWEVNKFSLLAGPQFDLLIKAEEEGENSSEEVHLEERSLGATVGLEFQLWESFGIGGKYMHGLNHIGLGQQITLQEFKYEMVQVWASYSF